MWLVGSTFLGVALAGCAASGTPRTMRGQSGAVTWEVTDIRERSEDRGRFVRWTYTVTLRNTGPIGINLVKITRDVQARSDVWGGQQTESGARRLDAGGTLRMSETYAHWCRDCDLGYAATMLRQGVTRVVQYEGADDQRRPVAITLLLPLYLGAGTATPEERAGFGATGRYHGMLSYYPARTTRRYPSVSIQAILEQTATDLSGEIASREDRGSIRGTVRGEELSGEFRLGDVACRVTGQVLGDGATLTGTFECDNGEAGSLVVNRM
jgi:hypothetical protein